MNVHLLLTKWTLIKFVTFSCNTEENDGFENLPLNIDGFRQTHRTHANDTTDNGQRDTEGFENSNLINFKDFFLFEYWKSILNLASASAY